MLFIGINLGTSDASLLIETQLKKLLIKSVYCIAIDPNDVLRFSRTTVLTATKVIVENLLPIESKSYIP